MIKLKKIPTMIPAMAPAENSLLEANGIVDELANGLVDALAGVTSGHVDIIAVIVDKMIDGLFIVLIDEAVTNVSNEMDDGLFTMLIDEVINTLDGVTEIFCARKKHDYIQ